MFGCTWAGGKPAPALALLFVLVACPKGGEVEVEATPELEASQAWRPAPPPDDDVIYFAMVDRFHNGDPSNDGNIDLEDPTAFHGGDIQGVIDKLDYLQALGVRTIWLSPVYQMRTDKFFEWGAFHGYWVQDPGRVEPRFGDTALLRELSDQLHAREMRLLLDVVWNHVSFDAPLKEAQPDWFHQHGGIEDWNDPFELVNHEVHGLPDFAQEKPEVYDFLRDTSLRWVRDVQPDGFRVDAVRHMPVDFLASISADLQGEAGDGFFLLGEDFQGDPVALAESYEQGGFGSMFDFPMHYAMLDVFCDDRHPGRLAAMLSGDGAYPDAQGLVTFLDNHDLPRVLSRCHGDLARVRTALAFQLTTRGIPSITWGLEAGLEGEGEPDNRADMVFDRGHVLERDLRLLLDFRRRHPSLTHGVTYQPLATGKRLLIYARLSEREEAIIAYNGADEPVPMAEDPGRIGWQQPIEALIVEEEPRLYSFQGEGNPLPPTLAPGGLAVIVLGADEGLAPGETVAQRLGYELPGALTTRLPITASGVTLGEGDELVLTGSGRALGNWNPSEPAGLFAERDGQLVLELDAPSETVLEVKLVLRHPDGSVTWQEGENRYLHVPKPLPPADTLLGLVMRDMLGDEGGAELSWAE